RASRGATDARSAPCRSPRRGFRPARCRSLRSPTPPSPTTASSPRRMSEHPPAWPAAAELEAPLPPDTDVLIAGGGLAGCALAYYLAREGVDVALVERGELNREASGTNAGSFHFQIAIHQLSSFETGGEVRDRLLAEVRLLAEAAALWSTLENELAGPLDVHITGGLMVAETTQELQLLREKVEIERDAGLETHLLVGDELRAFAPFLADDLTGAVYC